MVNDATTLVRDQSPNNFTRSDGPDTNQPAYPTAIVPASLPGSNLGFHRTLDAEVSDGTFYADNEYLIRFGCLLNTTYGSRFLELAAVSSAKTAPTHRLKISFYSGDLRLSDPFQKIRDRRNEILGRISIRSDLQ